ncbi:hypothetical protein BJ741DRAFT_611865 [Chytriomyces cf. hyalinus JEL632]|nr:hypothetical protein BJ741DRAFT_611865 [Chytriomyces cf. hyalinus JEL632]
MADGSHNQKKSSAVLSAAETEANKRRTKTYIDTWAVMATMRDSADPFDPSALDATQAVVELNPDAYTVWNYRRRILTHLFATSHSDEKDRVLLAKKDLKLLEKLIRIHPKSYWLWVHRRWVLENMPSPDWDRELLISQMMLDLDARNFHGWSYRRSVLKSAGRLPDLAEIEYTSAKIRQNFSNYSAWHYRSRLIPSVTGEDFEQRDSIIQKDFETVRNAIYTEPADQSAWLYQRWLLGQKPSNLTVEWAIAERVSNAKFIVFVCFNTAVSMNPSKVILSDTKYRFEHNATNTPITPSHVVSVSIIAPQADTPLNLEICLKPDCFNLPTSNSQLEDVSLSFDATRTAMRVEGTIATQSDAQTNNTLQSNQYQPREIWERELTSIRELAEFEPESKWPWMALVHCLRELGGESNVREAISVCDTLERLDPDRKHYYRDTVSDFHWNQTLHKLTQPTPSESTAIPPTPWKLTRIITPHLLPPILTILNLPNHALTDIPLFPCLRELNLDNNFIQRVRRLDMMPLLQRLSIKKNMLTSLRGLEVGKGLKEVWVAENDAVVERVDVEGVLIHY